MSKVINNTINIPFIEQKAFQRVYEQAVKEFAEKLHEMAIENLESKQYEMAVVDEIDIDNIEKSILK